MSKQWTRSEESKETVVTEGIYVRETEKALLLRIQCKEVWLPKSQLQKPSICLSREAQEWAVFIPRWLAEAKQLGYDEYEEEVYGTGEEAEELQSGPYPQDECDEDVTV